MTVHDEPEKQTVLVVCMKVKDAESDLVVNGSQRRACSECSEDIWVSPSGLAAPGAKLICMGCSPVDPDDLWKTVKPENIAPGAIEEITESIGMIAAAALAARAVHNQEREFRSSNNKWS